MKMYRNLTTHISLLSMTLLVSAFALSATAASAPTVSTGSADLMSINSVSASLTVNPNGDDTLTWFELGTTTSFGSTFGYRSAGSSTSSITKEAFKISLAYDTTYYYRAVAKNSFGTVRGITKSFKTQSRDTGSSGSSGGSSGNTSTPTPTPSGQSNNQSGPPSVATNGPASIKSDSVVVNGSINTNNSNSDYWFEIGETSSLGRLTSKKNIAGNNTWQLITEEIDSLKPGTMYYFRIVAENQFGRSLGDIKSFTTSGTSSSAGNSTSGNNSSTSGGSGSGTNTQTQTSGSSGVLGSSTSSTSGGTNSSNSSSSSDGKSSGQNAQESRPSFASLEYSLNDSDVLVLITEDIKPKPGDEFSYTVVYKNDTSDTFYGSNLKIILPSEVLYIDSNIIPESIRGTIVGFDLGDIEQGDQGAVVVVTRLRDDVKPETSIIFTSVLGYKDSKGVQLATTSYMTLYTGKFTISNSTASILSFFGSGNLLWLTVIALAVLMAFMIRRFIVNGRKARERFKKERPTREKFIKDIYPPVDDMHIPANFEPIGPARPLNR